VIRQEWVSAALLAALASAAGWSQAPAPEPPKPFLQELFHLPEWLKVEGEYRARFEAEDNRYRPGETGGDQQLAHRTRLRLGITRGLGPLRFLAELEDGRVSLTDSGSTITNIHVRKHGFLQLYGALVTNTLFGRPLHSEVQFGRLSFDLGKRRLVARNIFRNTTTRFDGIRWRLSETDRWELQLLLLQHVLYTAPDLNRGQRNGYFWGAYYQNRQHFWLQHDLYYLHLHETQQQVGPSYRQLKTFGARLYSAPSEGGWVYEIESAWQFGRAAGLKDFGHLQNVEAGHRWSTAWKPQVLFQYTYASGDRNPYDDHNDRFDGLFGSRRFELAPTGIYALISRGNLNAPGYRVVLNPKPTLELTFIHRDFRLAQSRDQWVGVGRRDLTGKSGTHLGQQPEGILRWKATRNLEYSVCYLRFLPGDFVRNTVPGNGSRAMNYFYISQEVHF
jgi:hypothetical protein